MSRSFHQSKSRDFILDKKTTKFKNRHKTPTYFEESKSGPNIYWKRKRHLAYGELRNFNFRGRPVYAGETYCCRVGEYCTSVIEPAKERRKNKISIYTNFDPED